MSNSYFDWPAKVLSARFVRFDTVRSEDGNRAFDEVSAGFEKMPSPYALNSGSQNYGADIGAVDAMQVVLSAQFTSYADGAEVKVKALLANTSTAPTIDVKNGAGGSFLGAKTIVRVDGTPLAAGDIKAGQILLLTYDGTSGKFQLNASGALADATAAAASAAAALVSEGIAGVQAGIAVGAASAAGGFASTASTAKNNAVTAQGLAEAARDLAQNYVAGLSSTSATSNTVATGAKSWTTQLNKLFAAGMFFSANSVGTPGAYMHGVATAYNAATGAFTGTVLDIGGSGTFTDWAINVSGSIGPTGATGPAASLPPFLLTNLGIT